MTSNYVAATLPYSTSLCHSMKNYRMAALSWYQFGFNVIPIRPKAKTPALTWDPWLQKLSPENITRHWLQHPDHEVGFIVGDGLIVFDADSSESKAALAAIEKSFSITPSLVVNTRRGEHHYFRRSQGTYATCDSHSTEEHPDRLDVKTERALIILPPSTGKTLPQGMQELTAKNAVELTEIGQEFIDAVARHNGRILPRPPVPFKRPAVERPRCSLRLLEVTIKYISSDSGYEDWLHVGMALHRETSGSDEGYDLFDAWSSKGKKYRGSGETSKKWLSFRSDLERGFTIGTLFMLAGKAGVTPEMIYAEVEQFQKIGGQNGAA